jgi:tetratricopeptide (TPR) repeat protein
VSALFLLVILAAAGPVPTEVEVRSGEAVEIEVSQERGDRVLHIEGPAVAWDVNWRRPPRVETALLVEPGRYRIAARDAPGQAPSKGAPAVAVHRRAAREDDAARALRDAHLARAAGLIVSGAVEDARTAREILEQALGELTGSSIEDRTRNAEVRLRLGELLLNAGRAADAEAHHREALATFEDLGDRAGAIDARTRLGLVQNWRGNPMGAHDEYQRALAEAVATKDHAAEALIRGNLGSTYVYLGESQKAIESFRAAIVAAKTAGAGREEAWAHSNLARGWHAVGDFERALEYARQALPLMERAKDAKGKLGVLLNTGVILTAMGRHAEAETVLEQGLALASAAGDEQTQAALLGRLGEARAGKGDSAAAIETFRRALALYEKQKARRAEGLVLAGLGAVQQRAGDPEARASLERALERGRASGDPSVEAAALKGLAADALAKGELARARELSAQALAVVESLRLQVLAPEFRSSYFASVQDYYEQSIAVLMASHHEAPEGGFAAEAFHVSERARARSLLEGLAGGRADIRAGVAPELLEREGALQKELGRASRRFLRLLSASARDTEVAAAEKEIAGLVSQHQELQAELRAKSPRYAALTQPVPLTAAEVQAELAGEETTLVEFALGEAASYAFVLDRAGLHVATLPPRREIEVLARAACAVVATRPPSGASGAPAPSVLGRLSRAILPPLVPRLHRRVVFVAQGALQYVPFAALHRPGDAKPLVEEHELVVLPSASMRAVLRRELAGRLSPPGRIAILADPVFDRGDPRLSGAAPPPSGAKHEDRERSARATRLDQLARLPFTRREAAAIQKTAGTAGVRTALGFEASRALAVSDELSRYRVLHFATHGLVNDERPELSGLVLSLFDKAGRPTDGFLRLADIYNLALPADLVVLSACRTGLGKNVRGEGLVGLTRAFMYAGAARVLASLWTVDDAATAELMAQFYRILFIDGRPPEEALRGAQNHMRRHARWRHPYYWAAFTLQGQW